jgi:hypothetical protein
MKKIILLVAFLLTFLFTFSSVNSQIIQSTGGKFKPPITTIEILFNYNQPLPHLYGDIKDFFNFENYGVKYGFGSQISVKITTDKKGTMKPYLNIGYNMSTGSDNSFAYIDSNIINTGVGFPSSSTANYYGTPGTSKIYLHNFYAGLGFCYDFVNKKNQWVPFLLTQLDLNVLFGTYKQNPYNPPTPIQGEVSFTIKEAVRFGFSIGGGVQLRLGKYVGLTWSAKYKFANLFGRNSEKSTELNKINLMDAKNTDLHVKLEKSRLINYLEFGLGVAFYIGKK